MNETPVLTLIQQIKSKQIDPSTLSQEQRRQCVELLRIEGYQVPEIGQILKKNERTIRRDLEQIRQENAVARDPAMVERVVGDVLRQAEGSRAHLRRIAREQSASAMERLMAEQSAWKVTKECAELLQSLGYLPKVPTTMVADIHQHVEVEPIAGYDELHARMTRLKSITGDSQNREDIARLMDEVERGRIAARLDTLSLDDATNEENDA